jgi:acyl carrier protein phosphodiesterase
MNYLAHAYLSDTNEESIIGNLLGDFVKGNPDLHYKGEVLKWIRIHRKIDSFTDSHSIFRSSKRLISHQRRRYSGIIIDICFDHFLAKNWPRYSSEELPVFIERVYSILDRNKSILPERLKSILPRLISEDWFHSYKSLEGVDSTLNRMSKRFKKDNSLAGSVDEIARNYSELESNFFSFFPELITFVKQLKQCY